MSTFLFLSTYYNVMLTTIKRQGEMKIILYFKKEGEMKIILYFR